HRTTGDDSSSARGRLEQHSAGAVATHDLMRNRGADPGQLDHRPLGGVNRLAHRFRDFIRLAGRDADLALAVADGDQGIEREAPAALDDLRHPVDRDHVFDELAVLALPVPVPIALAAALAATTTTTATAPAARCFTGWGARASLGARRRCLFLICHARTPVRLRARLRQLP